MTKPESTPTPERRRRVILSYDDLKKKGIRFSRVWILHLIREGKFPKTVKLGESHVGFVEEEIDAWIDGLIQARDGEAV
jgi:prophage regulatory protein